MAELNTDLHETVRARYGDVEVRETHRVHAQASSAIIRARKPSA